MPPMEIILASQSPRRKMLLEMLGLRFNCLPADIDETSYLTLEPREAVQALARAKAETVPAQDEAAVVIAADTIVVCNDLILGKPEGKQEAFNSLSLLSGKCHQVITALCVKNLATGQVEVKDEITRVFFRNINEAEIWAYIKTGEPADKAGAYAIQGVGSVFVERIEGCYYNVVGLPLQTLYMMLKRQGVNVLGV